MRILAFLQNQWFRDPEKAAQILERHPEHRNRFIAAWLFMGCLTGRRLKQALGEPLCAKITWEEVSPRIGGHSSSSFEPDPAHIQKAIAQHRPDVIVCFGRVAGDALRGMTVSARVLYAPHPAARNNPMKQLLEIASKLRELEA